MARKPKRRKKKKRSVSSHVNNLSASQRKQLMSLADELGSSKRHGKRRQRKKSYPSRRRRRRNPGGRPYEANPSEVAMKTSRRERLFDALKENRQVKRLDELNELLELKESGQAEGDNRLLAEIENRIEEIKEELPLNLMLSMQERDIFNRVKSLRTQESKRAAKKYARRRLLSQRERYRALLAIYLASGAGPSFVRTFQAGASKIVPNVNIKLFLDSAMDNLGISPAAGDYRAVVLGLINAMPVDLNQLSNGAIESNVVFFYDVARDVRDIKPSELRDMSYGGEYADAALLALPPDSIREAVRALDEMIEPNLISNAQMIRYTGLVKRTKKRLEALLGGGRIINTARYMAKRASNPSRRRARRKNPAREDIVSLMQANPLMMPVFAGVGGIAGYFASGAVRMGVDALLGKVLSGRPDTSKWVGSIASALVSGGLAAWLSGNTSGALRMASSFAVAGVGARLIQDIVEVSVPSKNATYRMIRSAANLSGGMGFGSPFSVEMERLHGYMRPNAVMAGYAMQQPTMGGAWQSQMNPYGAHGMQPPQMAGYAYNPGMAGMFPPGMNR